MPNIGSTEIIILLIILVLFFGSNRLTEFAKNAGKATKEIKRAQKEFEETKHELTKQDKDPIEGS